MKSYDNQRRQRRPSIFELAKIAAAAVLSALALAPAAARAQTQCVIDHQSVPADIQAIFDKPFYNGAIWRLHVVDLDSGKTLIDLQPDCLLFIGSVRKSSPWVSW